MMPNNMMQFIQIMRSGGNPQQMVMTMLEGSSQGNPIMANLFTLAKNGNTQQIEQIARNMTKERGMDFDKEFNSFKQMLGFK